MIANFFVRGFKNYYKYAFITLNSLFPICIICFSFPIGSFFLTSFQLGIYLSTSTETIPMSPATSILPNPVENSQFLLLDFSTFNANDSSCLLKNCMLLFFSSTSYAWLHLFFLTSKVVGSHGSIPLAYYLLSLPE